MCMEKRKVIIDHIGRVVAGHLVSETDTTLTLSNPIVVFAEPNAQTGQISVQSFPYMFIELIAPDERDKNDWVFHKSQIVQAQFTLEDKIEQQCDVINTRREPAQEETEQQSDDGKVISIND